MGVLLLKADADKTKSASAAKTDDTYLKLLRDDLGLDVIQFPVLKFNFVNQEILLNNLDRPDNFSGIVFTSPRSVEAVWRATDNGDSLKSSWTEELPCYVVGEATAAKVIELLSWKPTLIRGQGSGNASNLADLILEHHRPGDRFLFPCGNLKQSDIEKVLCQHGISVVSVIAYETVPREDIEDEIKEKLDQPVDFVVYFSPSGVKVAYEQLTKHSPNAKIISIGPTTSEALSTSGCNKVHVADKPNADSVAKMIRDMMT